MTPAEVGVARQRRERAQARLAKYIRNGNWWVTLLAYEGMSGIVDDDYNPPYVQYTWRDDLRLQVETQGDHYRLVPYSDSQVRILEERGFAAPFALGEEFCNRTILHEGEAQHPESVAKHMIDTLFFVHGVHFHSLAMSARHGVPHWTFEWNVCPSTRDIEAELRARYLSN